MKTKNKTITAGCAWGAGVDVILSLNGHGLMLFEEPKDKKYCKHGFITNGQIDLTAKEALDLARALILAATEAQGLDSMCKIHDNEKEDITKFNCND